MALTQEQIEQVFVMKSKGDIIITPKQAELYGTDIIDRLNNKDMILKAEQEEKMIEICAKEGLDKGIDYWRKCYDENLSEGERLMQEKYKQSVIEEMKLRKQIEWGYKFWIGFNIFALVFILCLVLFKAFA